jgi:hypothetical protein
MRPSRILMALLFVASCGGDEGGGGAKPAAKPAGNARAAAKPAAQATTQQLAVYKQVESLAADEKEANSLRHQFRDTDFQVDPTGTVNRDPFRSFVINQPGVASGTGDTTLTAEPTELCPAKKQMATSYMARELKLTGIVARGTTRWALFTDTASKGHIIHRNDCIGKEKARVVEIGAAYAKVEISAEPLPGQPPRPPDVIIYQLYPQQLPIGQGGSTDDGATPSGPGPT